MSFDVITADICRARSLGDVVLLLTIVFALGGCRYPEVSPRTYEIAQALYSATNLKQEQRLDALQTLISSSRSAGEITEREGDYLTEIIEMARQGEWNSAQLEVRQLMEDQVSQ